MGVYLPRSLLGPALSLALLADGVPADAADDSPTFADRSTKDVVDVERTFGIMLDPLAIAMGVYGGDVDLVLGKHFALSLEGGIDDLNGTTATALGVGLLCYPHVAFHGLYLEPRVAYARPLRDGLFRIDWSADVLGFGATAGWQWIWDYGFTIRLGGGGMDYLGGPAPGALALRGPQLVVDGSLGWAF
jgi:hypothetical protein